MNQHGFKTYFSYSLLYLQNLMSLNNRHVLAEIENEGKDCWEDCNEIQGKCSYCGSMGFCCRKNYYEHSNGCDGTFGGDEIHVCVLPPGNYSVYWYTFYVLANK